MIKLKNVLSLFDGISAGQVALQRANIKFDNYYASEISKYPIQITQKNFPNTIQVGNITELESSNFVNIDLLIGGSPCTNLSVAGNKEGMITKDKIEITTLEQYLKLKKANFKFVGQSYLFWEYVRLLKELKPKFFLLENVSMATKWKNIFSKTLGVEPIEINSSLVSAQNRKRLYWTNIPNITQPEDKKLFLKDIIETTNQIDYNKIMTPTEQKKINKTKNCYCVGKANLNGHDYLKRVYDTVGKSPTLASASGGNLEPKIFIDDDIVCGAFRGRYVDETKTKTNQKLELRKDNKTNVLTTVQKDNVIVSRIEKHHSKNGLQCVGGLNKTKKWLENGKTLQRNFSQGERIYSSNGKSPTLSANAGGTAGPGNALITENVKTLYWRKLTPVECERLQTFEDNYTEGVSKTQRYRALGNSWTIDVIKHIFSFITNNKESIIRKKTIQKTFLF